MAFVPKSLLRRLYIKDSLKNRDNEGFEFKMRNTLATGTITELIDLKIDDESIDAINIFFEMKDKTIQASQVSSDNPLRFTVGTSVTVFVKGKTLSEGEHKMEIAIKTREYGPIRFDITDII